MNNQERKLWVDNDEGMYLWRKSSKLSMTKFIRENKTEIDECINRAMNPQQKRY